MEVAKPRVFEVPLEVIEKTMTGPGPSNYPERVRKAMALPILGQLHQETFKIMDDIKEGIKYLFQTKNPLTFCISGPGHAGLECALVNLLEDGDTILIAAQGIWGQRAENIAERLNADVKILKKLPGEQVSVSEVRESFLKFKPKIFFIAHGESSTGMLQDALEDIGDLCREFKCLFIVDSVITLGCVPFYADKWKIDVVYTGTQKVLNAPPGITPISFSERALTSIKSRKSLVKSYNYDAIQLGEPNCPRIYHHTICSTLLYGLREAIAILLEQGGLESSWEKHARVSRKFHQLLEKNGFKLFIGDAKFRCPSVTSIVVPDGVDPFKVTAYAMRNFKIEIGGGLGPTVGKIFRIGLMGINANEELAERLVNVLKEAANNSSERNEKLAAKI